MSARTRLLAALAGGLALTFAVPVAAQSAPAPDAATGAAALPEPDPERLAAAERVVDRIWPLGTFRRVMDSTVDSTVAMVTGAGEAMVDAAWNLEDNSKEARRAQHEARTGRPLSGTAEGETAAVPSGEDVEAQMRRMNDVMLPIFERMEPPIRAALTRVYARRYSVVELNELDTFFSTPTGARYAADSITIMNDPEMVQAMATVMGDIMPALMGAAMDPANADAATTAAADAAAAAADAAVMDAAGVRVE